MLKRRYLVNGVTKFHTLSVCIGHWGNEHPDPTIIKTSTWTRKVFRGDIMYA